MTFRASHVDELISASLAGDLTEAERAELDAHLARCEECRATLAAFRAERRILSGLPAADPPRDLAVRVRTGIESGRLAGPWWRGPRGLVALVASVSAVAAVALAMTLLSKLPVAPVGQQSDSPAASVSAEPSSSTLASVEPSAEPSAPPPFELGPGELGYFSLNGAPFEELRLTFINDATGASIDAGTVSGPPIAASLSPDGKWLAYITRKGESGANEVWGLRLADAEVIPLGCSAAAPFTDRLAWSPNGAFLAYTLVGVELGVPTSGCDTDAADVGKSDAWAFDTASGERRRVTSTGNAYTASFLPGGDGQTLMVSFAAEAPWTETVPLPGGLAQGRIDGVFLPLYSPDGNRALFWSGTMAPAEGAWQFSRDGMPQLSGDFRATGPASPWLGAQLFTDLIPVGGEAFAYGSFSWGTDSDTIAFWDGAWTGAPQGAGGYPDQRLAYLGSVSGSLLSAASRFAPDLGDDGWIVDLTYGPEGALAVTIGLPSAGIGDPPSARIEVYAVCCEGEPSVVGGGVEPPPWDGPPVYGR